MNKLYSLPGILLSIIFLAGVFVMVQKSSEEAHLYKEEKMKVAEILNFNDRLLSFRDWVFTEAAWLEKKAKFETVLEESKEHLANAKTYGSYILYGSGLFLLAMALLYIRKRIFFGLTLGLSVVALALLYEGVSNPMMEMAAFKEDLTIKVYVKPKDIPYFEDFVDFMEEAEGYMISTKKATSGSLDWIPYIGESLQSGANSVIDEGAALVEEWKEFLVETSDTEVGMDKVFDGRTYFYYENKGILEIISLLWNTGNEAVAAAIGTFSVIVPGIKLLLTLIILIFPIHGAKRLRKVLSYIAKWSMADVFVVGAFLTYLSFANMNPGVDMEAEALFGLYYFMGYVVISIVLGYLLDASIKEKIKIREAEQTELSSVNETMDNDFTEQTKTDE